MSTDLALRVNLTSLSPNHSRHPHHASDQVSTRQSYVCLPPHSMIMITCQSTMTLLSTLRGGEGGGESDDDWERRMVDEETDAVTLPASPPQAICMPGDHLC